MAEFADPFIFAFYFGDIVDDAGIEANAGIVGVIFGILEIAFIAVDRDGLILGGFGVGIEFAHGLKRWPTLFEPTRSPWTRVPWRALCRRCERYVHHT